MAIDLGDLTHDTFESGVGLDLVNFAADIGTIRDRGARESTAYVGVDYGRDIVLIMEVANADQALKNEILRSPALDGLGAEVTIDGLIGQVETLAGVVTFEKEGLANGGIT